MCSHQELIVTEEVLNGWESFHQRNNSFREHNTLFSKHMQPSLFYTYNTAYAEHRWSLWYNIRIVSYQQKPYIISLAVSIKGSLATLFL